MSPIDYLQFVLAPQILNGLTLGVAVVLVALGLTIIFGMLDVINMSHGEFYAVGAYAAVALGAAGVGFWFLLVLVPILMIPLGMVAERLLIRPVFDSKDRHVTTLLVTFGLGLVVEDGLKVIFGANTQRPPTPIPGATEWFGILVPSYRLFLLAVGAAIIGGVAYVVYRTRLGAMVRAAAFDRHMAASLGVPVSVVYAGTFAFGVALAGLAGVLLAPIYSVFPTMGRDFILLAFSVVIVGGMGSIWGCVFAGLLLTQVQALASLVISPIWTDPIVFGTMVAFLMVRPQGLFGRLGHA
ncbi:MULTISPECIES: branched-chain amino acid ABC transporter permease [Bradyrhizobium]|uniref:branched-chain amino acid ABC transporter permease n=1 Tax=Bradyrhizobium TaxID=374 RepID=UPI0023025809|nr:MULTISPECIES: branched-chain amino acid ABC transporter permease [Bradyrhizobium]MDA9547688.1 ABC transporter permease [Bradyrhizobium sp. CCBAU 45321]MDF0584082.1 branched-chain amino acid ABC transporter permease [Bradyrhizobium yuanmingense]